MQQLQEFLQQLINGLSVGAIYALIAVGYTMVYGVLQLINFAHGDVFMVGAMLTLVLGAQVGFRRRPNGDDVEIVSGLSCCVRASRSSLCGLLGFLIERLAYRPLRDKPRINSLITAIGISLLLEFGGQHRRSSARRRSRFPWTCCRASPKCRRSRESGQELYGIVISRVDALVLVRHARADARADVHRPEDQDRPGAARRVATASTPPR